MLRLGVNIDHVATVRNARGTPWPDPVRAALHAIESGADGITVHIREDRRHIREDDIERLLKYISVPINLEMAITPEMEEIALRYRTHAVCLVPEKRQELTTETGLDIIGRAKDARPLIRNLTDAKIRVSIFIDPIFEQIKMAHELGANIVELHTGYYCDAHNREAIDHELWRLREAATYADKLGLEVHAGHGLSYATVRPVAAIPQLKELNIGHFLIGDAIIVGLGQAIKTMKEVMATARS